jgi:hypothetical protein
MRRAFRDPDLPGLFDLAYQMITLSLSRIFLHCVAQKPLFTGDITKSHRSL